MEALSAADLDGKLAAAPFVMLDFSSPGCAPCKKIAQALPGWLAELQPAAITAYEVDITVAAAVAARFFVMCVPTLILFKQGKVIARYTSLPKTDTVRRLLS